MPYSSQFTSEAEEQSGGDITTVYTVRRRLAVDKYSRLISDSNEQENLLPLCLPLHFRNLKIICFVIFIPCPLWSLYPALTFEIAV